MAPNADNTHRRRAQLDTVIGLHDLHYVLAGDTDFDAFLRKTRGVAITLHERDRVASWAAGGGGAPVRVKASDGEGARPKPQRLSPDVGKIEGMRVRVGELLGLATLPKRANTRLDDRRDPLDARGKQRVAGRRHRTAGAPRRAGSVARVRR